jgi:oligogalacturonide lyase
MNLTKSWPAETKEYSDHLSGVRVRQLTNGDGDSHHLYFTNPGWHDGGRRLVYASRRENAVNLWSLDLADATSERLTSFGPDEENAFLFTCLNPVREEAYFWRGKTLVALDLQSLEQREIYQTPDGFDVNMLNCSADGKHICTGIYEDLSSRFNVDLLHGYVGFEEYFRAHPLSQILKIATDGSGAEVVWEENNWIGHVNTSPRHAHLLSFCHEGPWNQVAQRMWGLDLTSGEVWKIRPQASGETIGHEYWLADGETIGYHGHLEGKPVFGLVRYDNSQRREAVMPDDSHHFHSNGPSPIIGDGMADRCILLWRWEGAELEPPRVLCHHGTSFKIQQVHAHPRFSPDGSYAIFTSDHGGVGNIYQVEIPEMESLPLLGDLDLPAA